MSVVYSGTLAAKIAKNMMNIVKYNVNNFIQGNAGMNNSTSFVYRVNPNQKMIVFQNLQVCEERKGQGVLTGVLNLIEPVCDQIGYTIKVADFCNIRLAKYFKVKRGYKLYNQSHEITNLTNINKYLNRPKGMFGYAGINTKQIPDHAIRKPKK